MEDDVSELKETHLYFHDLSREEFKWFMSKDKKLRSGTNPKTLNKYVSLIMTSYQEAEELFNNSAINKERVQLKYHIFSNVSWGNFTVPNEGVELAKKYGLSIKVCYMTPPR